MMTKENADRKVQTKTIAIVGASGFIGMHLVDELRRLGGYRIKLLSRSPDKSPMDEGRELDVEVFKGDLREPESLREFLEDGCTVINLVYLWGAGESENLEAIANLVEACKVAKIARLIHCSTAEVVGRVTADLITEITPCHPVTEYGVTKLKVEQEIIRGGEGLFDVAVLRPTAVFGPGGKNLLKLAKDIVAGSRLKNYLKSCVFGRRRVNLVPVANVVGAIIFLMRYDSDLNGEVFIVSDDDSPANNFADVEKFLMKELRAGEYPMPRIPLPLGLLAFLLALMGRNNVNPRCNYASNKLHKLGFEHAVTFEAALAEYAAWYRSSQLS